MAGALAAHHVRLCVACLDTAPRVPFLTFPKHFHLVVERCYSLFEGIRGVTVDFEAVAAVQLVGRYQAERAGAFAGDRIAAQCNAAFQGGAGEIIIRSGAG